MESKASSTSNLVIHRPEALLSCSERASAAVSSQPVRRGRRVTDPNSWPVRARAAPACAQRAGLLASYNSLGKGPPPPAQPAPGSPAKNETTRRPPPPPPGRPPPPQGGLGGKRGIGH